MLVDLFLADLDDLSDSEVLHEVSHYAIILDDECTMCETWRNTIRSTSSDSTFKANIHKICFGISEC
jgi:hypothetical protein